jgi:hypothetical protein
MLFDDFDIQHNAFLRVLLFAGRVIFNVTVSPAFCSRCTASVNVFPRKLTPFIASRRSPTCRAPVLNEKFNRSFEQAHFADK